MSAQMAPIRYSEKELIMMFIKRASAAALIAATFAFGASAVTMSANAGPAGTVATVKMTDTGVTKVEDRRHHGGRRGHHRGYNDGWNPGAAIGLGIAGAVIAGALDDEDGGYDEGPAYNGGGGGVRRCAEQFRSFEIDTGMYTTYGGERRMCPYLG
jgi:hypothetical protein